MAHARTQIRNAVKAIILPISVFSSNVFVNRSNRFQVDELPAVNIFNGPETSQIADVHETMLQRDLVLNISIKAAALSDIDTLLDNYADEVETAIDESNMLGNLVQAVNLIASNLQVDEEAATPFGELLLQYQIIYLTPVGQPDQIIQ